jgi:hypothetical protein
LGILDCNCARHFVSSGSAKTAIWKRRRNPYEAEIVTASASPTFTPRAESQAMRISELKENSFAATQEEHHQ